MYFIKHHLKAHSLRLIFYSAPIIAEGSLKVNKIAADFSFRIKTAERDASRARRISLSTATQKMSVEISETVLTFRQKRATLTKTLGGVGNG
jgi:hypothetical protein